MVGLVVLILEHLLVFLIVLVLQKKIRPRSELPYQLSTKWGIFSSDILHETVIVAVVDFTGLLKVFGVIQTLLHFFVNGFLEFLFLRERQLVEELFSGLFIFLKIGKKSLLLLRCLLFLSETPLHCGDLST